MAGARPTAVAQALIVIDDVAYGLAIEQEGDSLFELLQS
jgi:hypothetical protein